MLTDRQERFCQEYLIDLNATQAYIRAGYSARTAHNCASRLMAKAGVRARIDELMAVRSRRTGVTQERVVRELARIAFVDPTQAIDFECAGLREDAEADDRAALMSVRVKSGDDFTEREVRLYDKLFTEANMNGIPEGSDYKDYLNPESVTVRTGCKLEESLKDAKPGEKFQFVRTGFFTPDSKNPGVYNRVVTLRDSFKPAK